MRLLNCPFCGSNDIYLRTQAYRDNDMCWIYCGCCGVKTKAFVYTGSIENPDFNDKGSILAATAWNRRVGDNQKGNNSVNNLEWGERNRGKSHEMR